MRLVKYFVCFCVFFVGLLIIAESYIFRIDNFYTEFSNTTMYIPFDKTDSEMKSDILQQADAYGIDIFTIVNENESFLRAEYTIYGTDNVENYLNNNVQIEAKIYDSLFMGERSFYFDAFKNIPNMAASTDFYMIGDQENIRQFKISLIDNYSGNHPREGTINYELRNNALSIWLVITAVILSISLYDISMRKKENLLRISFGERISTLILKNALLDSFIFTFCFVTSVLILNIKTNVYFYWSISLTFFVILLFLNAGLYGSFYFYRLREVFVTTRGSKKLLASNYGVKIITTIIMITLLASNIKAIHDAVSLFLQRGFFEERSNYEYIEVGYNPVREEAGKVNDRFEESSKLKRQFYQHFFAKDDALVLSNTTHFDYYNRDILTVNKNTYNYLLSEIPSLGKHILVNDIYFLIPKSFAGSVNIEEELQGIIQTNEGDSFKYSYDTIYYPENVSLINIKKGYGYETKWSKNPIIVYYNISEDTAQRETSTRLSTYLLETMYDISEADFAQFVEDNNLENEFIMKTNVWESYLKDWNGVKRILYINTIFTALMLILNFLIVRIIIRFEYEVNAIELSLKKVMGYNTFEKNKKLMLTALISSLLSIVAAVTIGYFLAIDGLIYIMLGGLAIVFIEVVVISFYMRKIEKSKITNILKGGNI